VDYAGIASAALPHGGGHIGAGHAPSHMERGQRRPTGQHAPVSPFNFITIRPFSPGSEEPDSDHALLEHMVRARLMIALGAGLFGAAIVFLFLTRVLISHEETWTPPTTRWSACWDEFRCHP